MRAHQPGSTPIDIPETVPNPAYTPRPAPAPERGPTKAPEKVPEKQSHDSPSGLTGFRFETAYRRGDAAHMARKCGLARSQPPLR